MRLLCNKAGYFAVYHTRQSGRVSTASAEAVRSSMSGTRSPTTIATAFGAANTSSASDGMLAWLLKWSNIKSYWSCHRCHTSYTMMTPIFLTGTLETASASAASSIDNMCPKCGIVKKSGKLSCCARGGAWFKNCGNDGDREFDHTWVEGIEACKSRLRRY